MSKDRDGLAVLASIFRLRSGMPRDVSCVLASYHCDGPHFGMSYRKTCQRDEQDQYQPDLDSRSPAADFVSGIPRACLILSSTSRAVSRITRRVFGMRRRRAVSVYDVKPPLDGHA